MRLLPILLAMVALLPRGADSQTTGAPGATFRVQIFGTILADFSARLDRYREFRARLEDGLPPLTVTDDPAQILEAETALAKRMRAARPDVRRGELFTQEIGAELRRVLLLEMDRPTRAAIMDENPGSFSHDIYGNYPKERPVSTVPPNILALLPALPDDMQYRFLGPHLVIHDTRANVIVDRLPCAIRCRD